MEFDLWVFVIQFATFLAGLAIIAKFLLPPLRSWMEQRQKRIQTQLEDAEKRLKEAEQLKGQFEDKVRELEKSTSDVLQRTLEEASRMKEEIIHHSRKEAEIVMATARKAIESERQEVVIALHKEVGALALDIAEKIIHSSVDGKVRDRMVKESLQELEAKKN